MKRKIWQRLRSRLLARLRRRLQRLEARESKSGRTIVSVRALCETLQVSTRGWYNWRDRAPGKWAQANMVLLRHIRRAHRASDETVRADLGGFLAPDRGHRCPWPQGRRAGLRGADDFGPCPLSADMALLTRKPK